MRKTVHLVKINDTDYVWKVETSLKPDKGQAGDMVWGSKLRHEDMYKLKNYKQFQTAASGPYDAVTGTLNMLSVWQRLLFNTWIFIYNQKNKMW